MQSKVLKIRNIPKNATVIKRVTLKPVFLLSVSIAVSAAILFFTSITVLGVSLLGLTSFFFFILPNHVLIEFTEEFLVLYNRKLKDECTLIYWNEILNYEYQSNSKGADILSITLIDDTVYTIECFSRNSIIMMFNQFAPNKEIRKNRRLKSR